MPNLPANRTPYGELWIITTPVRIYTYPSFASAFAAALRFKAGAIIEQIW